ncbi:MAG: shikimate kinase AroK [Pseudomonadota bacterium]
MQRRIFLVGPMGAGKSAVGRQLARLLGWPFEDADAWIETRTGVDIPYIFEREGESGFRKREHAAIETLTLQKPLVLATGGGVVMDPDNRRLLAERGIVVYLQATVAQQLARVSHSNNRPLLKTGDPEAILTRLFEMRDPLYREIADLTVTTDNQRVPTVARHVAIQLREQYDIDHEPSCS